MCGCNWCIHSLNVNVQTLQHGREMYECSSSLRRLISDNQELRKQVCAKSCSLMCVMDVWNIDDGAHLGISALLSSQLSQERGASTAVKQDLEVLKQQVYGESLCLQIAQRYTCPHWCTLSSRLSLLFSRPTTCSTSWRTWKTSFQRLKLRSTLPTCIDCVLVRIS